MAFKSKREYNKNKEAGPGFVPLQKSNPNIKAGSLTGVKSLHNPPQNTPASGGPKSSITRAGQKKNQTQILS